MESEKTNWNLTLHSTLSINSLVSFVFLSDLNRKWAAGFVGYWHFSVNLHWKKFISYGMSLFNLLSSSGEIHLNSVIIQMSVQSIHLCCQILSVHNWARNPNPKWTPEEWRGGRWCGLIPVCITSQIVNRCISEYFIQFLIKSMSAFGEGSCSWLYGSCCLRLRSVRVAV